MRPNAVLRLFVKHYTENRNKYLMLLLGTFALPVLMTLITKTSETGISMCLTVALFDIFYVAMLSTGDLRRRQSLVVANTLPVSVAERYAFILLNTTVVLAAWFVAVYAAAVSVSISIYKPIFPYFETLIFKNHYLYIGLLGTQGVALLISLAIRRRVFLPYVLAAIITIFVQYLISKYASPADVQDVKMWVNIAVTAVAWVAGYFMLRYRQLKM